MHPNARDDEPVEDDAEEGLIVMEAGQVRVSQRQRGLNHS